MEVPAFDLPKNVGYWLSEENLNGEGKEWIVNVDLDYFFYRNENDDYKRLYSGEYLKDLFSKIEKKCEDNTVAIITLALSPEFCGGWISAEALCEDVCQILKIPFSLPQIERDNCD